MTLRSPVGLSISIHPVNSHPNFFVEKVQRFFHQVVVDAPCTTSYIYNGSAFAVWIRLQDNADVIGTYLRPEAPPEHVDSLLHEIQARERYPTVVAGDLNARHRD